MFFTGRRSSQGSANFGETAIGAIEEESGTRLHALVLARSHANAHAHMRTCRIVAIALIFPLPSHALTRNPLFRCVGDVSAGEQCKCAGKQNKYKEGGSCATYRGYKDKWFNGVWCYADVNTCADASAHPASASQNVPGYGASRTACRASAAGTPLPTQQGVHPSGVHSGVH